MTDARNKTGDFPDVPGDATIRDVTPAQQRRFVVDAAERRGDAVPSPNQPMVPGAQPGEAPGAGAPATAGSQPGESSFRKP